jgi:hypothetical protein
MEEQSSKRKFTVQLSFEEIRLPPFEDILILGKKCSQGKIAVYKSFELLVPNEFEVFEIQNHTVEAVYINKKVLKKLEKDKILKVLEEKVFPFVSECEIIKVDFKLKIFYDSIEEEF